MLKKPEPEFNIEPVPNTKPETEKKTHIKNCR